MAAGIAFVHQELNLFDNLDVAANIFIGREPLTGGFLRLVDEKKLHEMVIPLLKRVGANFSASAPLASLSLAQRQMVEIAKALSVDARLVILDEPTSILPLSETERLLDVISGAEGRAASASFSSRTACTKSNCRRPRRGAARRRSGGHSGQSRDQSSAHGQADDRSRHQGARRRRLPMRPAISRCQPSASGRPLTLRNR